MRAFPGISSVAMMICFLGVAASGEDPNPAVLHSDRGAWPLYRQWNTSETHHFADWIAHIYERKVNGSTEQRLAKLERVLTDPEMNLLLDPEFAGEPCNPQVSAESIRAMHNIVDCHKLLMSLGSYYSCRRGLPFMYSSVRSSDGTDTRTAASTLPAGTVSSFDYTSAHQFFVDIVTGTCTGNLRVEPFAKNSEISDTCPVALRREFLMPGCAFYLDGHVLVLARIEAGGGVRFLDATTSSTRDLYTFNGMNAVTGIAPKCSENTANPYAGCFRGFRVLRYPVVETDKDGKALRVRRRTDAEMAEFGFSVEQYDRMEDLMKQGQITEDGLAFGSMHQFIRYRLREPRPVAIAALIQDFAEDFSQRLAARDVLVQEAWREVQANGPIEFPGGAASRNIHHAGGRWGAFSSALADAEMRGRYFELLEEVDAAVQWHDIRQDFLDLEGLNLHAVWTHSDLAIAVMRAKDEIFNRRQMTFTDSAGVARTLSLREVEQRLYDLSFDPNHPPEIRWGVQPGSPEAAGTPESPTPLAGGGMVTMAEAYRMERPYRSLTRREIEETPMSEAAVGDHYFREVMDTFLWPKWRGAPSPPLVPHGGRRAYEAALKK